MDSKDPQPIPSKRAVYLITINTNYRPTTSADSTAAGDILRSTLHDMFGTATVGAFVEYLPDPQGDPPGSIGDENDVMSIRSDIGVELGTDPKGSRVHAHIALDITHTTRIRVNLAYLRSAVRGALQPYPQFKGQPYVNVRFVKTRGLRDVVRYVFKTVDAKTGKVVYTDVEAPTAPIEDATGSSEYSSS